MKKHGILFWIIPFACACALAGAFLYAPARSFAQGPQALPYEIRATFITQKDAPELEISLPDDPSAIAAQDEDTTTTVKLSKKYNKEYVVFKVTPGDASKYAEGKTIRCAWEDDDCASDDPQIQPRTLTIKKDAQHNILYSEVTFRESFPQQYDVDVQEKDNTGALTSLNPDTVTQSNSPFIKAVPFTVAGETKYFDIVMNDESITNLVLKYYAPVDDKGSVASLDDPSPYTLGMPVSIGNESYRIEDAQKINKGDEDHKITLTLKKAPAHRFTIKYPVTGGGSYKFRVSSDIDSTYRVVAAHDGDQEITIDTALNFPENNSRLNIEPVKMDDGPKPLWDTNSVSVMPDFDVKTNTMPFVLWPKNRILITPIVLTDQVTAGTAVSTLAKDTLSDLKKITVTLTPVAENNGERAAISAPLVGTQCDAEHLGIVVDNVQSGTYRVTFSSTDSQILKTYDLSVVYTLVLDTDGNGRINYTAGDEFWYAPGAKSKDAAGLYPGIKTKLAFTIPHKIGIEKLVRNISTASSQKFSSSAKAKVGDTVEYQIKLTFPRDYNLLWKYPDSFILGSSRKLKLQDTLDANLAFDSESFQVVDADGKTVEGITHTYDEQTRDLLITDTRATKEQDIVEGKKTPQEVKTASETKLKLRDKEEVVYLRFKAKINGFGNEKRIGNTVGESTATIEQLEGPVVPTPQPEPPAPTPVPPAPKPAPTPAPHVPSLPLPQPQLQIPAARLVPAETLQAPAVTPAAEPAPAPAAPAPAAPEPALPQTGDEFAPAALLGSIAAFLSISFCALGFVLRARPRTSARA